MSTPLRIHLSVLLLAVLASVLLFAFDLIGRAQLLPVSAAFFAFGEITLLASRFYQGMAARAGAKPLR